MKKFELNRMTWKEVELILPEQPVVFLPVGSTEQNGAQNPLGNDFLVSDYFAKEVAKRTGSLVAPGIPYGNSVAFRGYPGTLWLRPETLYAVVRDALAGIAHHGFDHILVVNNHGPNEAMIEAAIRDLDLNNQISIALIWPSRLIQQFATDLYEDYAGARGHGAEPTTSIMMALFPDDVRMEFAKPDKIAEFQGVQILTSFSAKYNGAPVSFYTDMDQVSSTGITGDPMGASGERGAILLERLVSWGVEFATHFKTMKPSKPSAGS